jgi:hypothetical protein
MSKALCFPACDDNLQNLSQLLAITGSAIALGGCVGASALSLGAMALPCAGFLLGAASLVAPDDWWLNDSQAMGDVMTATDAYGCSGGDIGACMSAASGAINRISGIVEDGRNQNSGIRDTASVFPENPANQSGVMEQGGGLPSCPGSYICTPGSYVPCLTGGVKQCSFDCEWGSCESGDSCGDNICESDAGEDVNNCPSDCHPFAGMWSGTYSESSQGDGGCTYYNSGNMNLRISAEGGTFSGPSSITGIELRYISDCSVAWYESSTGSCTGTYNDTTITANCAYPVAGTGGTITFDWQATVTGRMMNGTFTGNNNGTFGMSR